MPAGPVGSNNPQLAMLQEALRRLREELQNIEAAISGAGGSGHGSGGGSGGGLGFPGFLSGGGGMFAGGGGDFVSPTVGLIINPNGTIKYDFEGHIKALGLDLPEGLDYSELINEVKSLISWEDESGTDHTFIGAVERLEPELEKHHFLILRANAQNTEDGGSIWLEAYGGAKGGTVAMRLQPSTGLGPSQVGVVVKGAGALVLDSENNSSFPQLPVDDHRVQNRGKDSVTFTASAFSNTITVGHELPETPSAILLTASKSGGTFVYPNWLEAGKENFKIQATVNGGTLSATVPISWFAST